MPEKGGGGGREKREERREKGRDEGFAVEGVEGFLLTRVEEFPKVTKGILTTFITRGKQKRTGTLLGRDLEDDLEERTLVRLFVLLDVTNAACDESDRVFCFLLALWFQHTLSL